MLICLAAAESLNAPLPTADLACTVVQRHRTRVSEQRSGGSAFGLRRTCRTCLAL